MKYASVCSGIEAPSLAWGPLGWTPMWFSEIETFPSAVLAHHYPEVPNLGDMTTIRDRARDTLGDVDVLVGGTPCQSFSVAGLRRGLDDARGNLALEFIRLVGFLGPRWIVWENVPGVLSADGGRAFGSILGALAELGYGFAWRVLDAQHFGVPQRRRRVFLVGHSGGHSAGPAAVLLEPEGGDGDLAPRRVKRKASAGDPANGLGVVGSLTASDGGVDDNDARQGKLLAVGPLMATMSGDGQRGARRGFTEAAAGHLIPSLSHALTTTTTTTKRNDPNGETLLPIPILEVNGRCTRNPTAREGTGIGRPGDPSFTVLAGKVHGVAVPFDATQITHKENRSRPEDGDPSPTLAAAARPPHIAYQCHGTNVGPMGTLRSGNGNVTGGVPFTTTRGGVRRLTPRECERLMGMPDDYTAIPDATDGPRYRAIGNSMAVPVVSWIGQRLQLVDQVLEALQEAA